jgi:CheY-like chemotaxis protein
MAKCTEGDTLVGVALHSKAPPAPRCLVVEDEALIARALVRDLERLGLRVSVASSLAAAQALGGEFDCSVIDLDLPDGCGFDVEALFPSGTFRSDPVFFSATAQPEHQAKAAQLGIFVSKSEGAGAAVRAACAQLTRAQASGKSGTFVRPSVSSSEHAGTIRAAVGAIKPRG